MTSKILRALLAGSVALLIASADTAAQPTNVSTLEGEVAALRAEVAKLSASGETDSAAVQAISTRLAELETQISALAQQQKAVPITVEQLDQLTLRTAQLESDVAALRTQLADVSQPSASSGGGGVSHEGGFLWQTDDGRYSVRLDGFMLAELELLTPSDLSTVTTSTFRLGDARIGFAGVAGRPELRYRMQFDFAEDEPLLDGYGEYAFVPALRLRVGQTKVPFSRSFLASKKDRSFWRLPEGLSQLRYDRDVGAWLRGVVAGDRLSYRVGFSSGGARSSINDNIDYVFAGRVSYAALGKRIPNHNADFERSADPRLTLGAAALHDLVRLPQSLGGVEVGNRDVDSDGVVDNIRVVAGTVDATFQTRGLTLALEGVLRHERWGTILDHADNGSLAELVSPDSGGNRNYLAYSAEANYFVLPKRLLVGARFTQSRQALLIGNDRNRLSAPRGDRLFELDALVSLYNPRGQRTVSLAYRLRNFGNKVGPEPDNDIDHRFLLSALLQL